MRTIIETPGFDGGIFGPSEVKVKDRGNLVAIILSAPRLVTDSADRSHVSGFFQVRPGEWRRIGVFGSYIGLVVGNIIVQYTFNDATFVSFYPADHLPYLFIVSSLVTAVMSSLYGSVSERLPARRLSWAMPALFCVSTLLCRLLLATHLPGSIFFIYIFLFGFNGLMVIIAWNFVRNGFDTRQVKRLMPLLGAIAGAGAILGGVTVRIAAGLIGTENLLIISAIVLAAAAGCALAAGPLVAVQPVSSKSEETFWKQAGAGFGLIRRNRLMLLTTGMLISAVAVRVLVDYQFKATLKSEFNRVEMASFLGNYFAIAFGLEFIFQLFLTARFMKRFGLTSALASRAAVISILAVTLLVVPAFWGVVAIKLTEGLLDRSLFQSGLSLVFAPLPARRGNLIRLTQEGIIQPLVVAAASLLLIFFSPVVSVTRLSWLVLGAAAVGILLALRTNRHYLAELSRAVQGHLFDYSQDFKIGQLMNEKTISCLAAQLRSGERDEILFTLHLIDETGAASLRTEVELLLEHGEAQVRMAAADALVGVAGKEAGRTLRARLEEEEDPRVIARVLRCLGRIEDDATVEAAYRLLEHGDVEVMSEALLLLFRLGGLDGIIVSAEKLATLKAGGPRERMALAGIIGRLKVENFDRTLLDLLRDPSPEVQRSVLEAARSLPSPRILAEVCRFLESERLSDIAEEVLIAAGADGVASLMGYLGGQQPSAETICHAARVFGNTPRAESLPLAEEWLESDVGAVRYEALKTLRSFRRAGIETAPERRDALLRREMILGLSLKLALSPEDSLLRRELKIRLDLCTERILLILGLRHDPDRIDSAGAGITGGDPHLRANALEYLDNLLNAPLESFFLALLEDIPEKECLESARECLGTDKTGLNDLRTLAAKDRWLSLLVADALSGQERILLDRATLLTRLAIFRDMSLACLWHLASRCRERRFAAGDLVFPAGAAQEAGYVILDGTVIVESVTGAAERLGRGEGVGIDTLFACDTGDRSARCDAGALCLEIGRREVEEMIWRHASAARAVVNGLLENFIAASKRELLLRKRSLDGGAR